MTLIQVNAEAKGLTGAEAIWPILRNRAALRRVIIMTHGLRFAPDDPAHCPHNHILSYTPRRCWKAISWPKHLGLDERRDTLGIAFGWPARGTLAQVADRAFDVGQDLAQVISQVHHARPDLRIHVMAHSLGARVVLAAMAELPPGALSRVILMSGAEYRSHALAAMTSPAGRRAQVLNVASGENTVFDGLFRLCIRAPVLGDRALSAGLQAVPGWMDLRIDCPDHLTALARMGVRIDRAAGRVCHWSTYLRPGVFDLYRRVLDHSGHAVLPVLAHSLATAVRPKRDRIGWPRPQVWSGLRP